MPTMRGNIVMTSPLSFDHDSERRKIDASLVDYVDLLFNFLIIRRIRFNLMGIDIDYSRFQAMSIAERKQFIRDIKINKVLNESNNN